MGDIHKISKTVTLEPKLVDFVDEQVAANDTDFSKEITKAVNLKKAAVEKKVYSYADELEAIPLSSPRGRSTGAWAREAAIGIYRLLEYFQQKDLDAANEKAKNDKKETKEA